jgi:hypothetical protein
MAYDQAKDKTIKTYPDVVIGDKTFAVAIYQYNGGEKKLGIQRKFKKKGGAVEYNSLGRLTRTEAMGLLPIIRDAINDVEVWG